MRQLQLDAIQTNLPIPTVQSPAQSAFEPQSPVRERDEFKLSESPLPARRALKLSESPLPETQAAKLSESPLPERITSKLSESPLPERRASELSVSPPLVLQPAQLSASPHLSGHSSPPPGILPSPSIHPSGFSTPLLLPLSGEPQLLPSDETHFELEKIIIDEELQDIPEEAKEDTSKHPITPTLLSSRSPTGLIGSLFPVDMEDGYNSDDSDVVGNSKRGIRSPVLAASEDSMQNTPNEDQMDSDAEYEDLDATIHTPEGVEVAEYDRRPFALNRSEIVSLVLHDMAVKYKASRSYVEDQRRLLAALGTKVLDYRAARRRVCNMTGVREVRYDCCPNGCMSYAMFPQLDTCLEPDCKHPRWKDSQRQHPHAQHTYIPIIPRLLHWWGSSSRAETMIQYRQRFPETYDPRRDHADFWTGSLYNWLRDRKRLFSHETDLAFVLSSDGVKVSFSPSPDTALLN
jgi:hypothetical protein